MSASVYIRAIELNCEKCCGHSNPDGFVFSFPRSFSFLSLPVVNHTAAATGYRKVRILFLLEGNILDCESYLVLLLTENTRTSPHRQFAIQLAKRDIRIIIQKKRTPFSLPPLFLLTPPHSSSPLILHLPRLLHKTTSRSLSLFFPSSLFSSLPSFPSFPFLLLLPLSFSHPPSFSITFQDQYLSDTHTRAHRSLPDSGCTLHKKPQAGSDSSARTTSPPPPPLLPSHHSTAATSKQAAGPLFLEFEISPPSSSFDYISVPKRLFLWDSLSLRR
ncbi:MAG: hypothetical protein JOS17DRAFT_609906 [Linnemannia elongata]|nr:MAG: hypothetical protein JOS17DRAFT_609906 [Linnemannia elongata]